MSKIFGELLMLIERDYRGTPAALAYDGQMFAVPENLYLIGMMNTADRSLAMIDYALRRRFSFLTAVLHQFFMETNLPWTAILTSCEYTAQDTIGMILEQVHCAEGDREVLYGRLRGVMKRGGDYLMQR